MSDITGFLIAIVTVIAGLFGLRFKWKSDAKKEAITKAKEADYEAAADLRDNVDRNLVDRVREMEGRGYRD